MNWPLSVIRLNSKNKNNLISLATKILDMWIEYSDENIVNYTKKTRHNTITPIARINDNEYELDLVLRNNNTSRDHPLGIYHPHKEYHNIKKENIGLIEVMGLAVLPSRLKDEMGKIDEIIKKHKNVDDILSEMKKDDSLEKHIDWLKGYIINTNLDKVDLKKYIGDTFEKVLENCKVLSDQKLLEFIKKIS